MMTVYGLSGNSDELKGGNAKVFIFHGTWLSKNQCHLQELCVTQKKFTLKIQNSFTQLLLIIINEAEALWTTQTVCHIVHLK